MRIKPLTRVSGDGLLKSTQALFSVLYKNTAQVVLFVCFNSQCVALLYQSDTWVWCDVCMGHVSVYRVQLTNGPYGIMTVSFENIYL